MLNSQYVINSEAIYEWNCRLYVFLDYMDGYEITNVIKDYNEHYSENFIKYSIYMVAKGLKDMHTMNILHRDIKSDNILCNRNGDIKVADLGLSVFLSEQQAYRKTRAGTINWMSPEIVKGTIYSKEVDIWAFGSYIYELGTGKPPFGQIRNNESLFNAILNKPLPSVRHRSNKYNELLQWCMKKNPLERPTME